VQNIKSVIYFIGIGLSVGFTLIVYAHVNFATKGTVERIERYQKENESEIKQDIREIKRDVREILVKVK